MKLSIWTRPNVPKFHIKIAITMIRSTMIVALVWSVMSLFSVLMAQDAYHTALLNQLQADYNVSGGTWVFGDNEVTKMSEVTSFGLTMTSSTVSGQDFTQTKILNITAPGGFPYNNVAALRSNNTVTVGDRLVFVVWARGISAQNSSLSSGKIVVERAGPPYEKPVDLLAQLDNQWTQFILPFESTDTYGPGELHFSFQVGFDVQELEFGGVAMINYGTTYTMAELPQKNFNDFYAGIEATAAWRAPADARIDQLRKSNLTVEVVDTLGNVLENATVNLEMQCHEFAFGTAVNGARFAGNSQQDAMYESKITDLDGQGHGFNMVVFENDLKWNAWEGNWPGTVAEKENAINWLLNRNIRIRGHVLVWPGWNLMPPYMEAAQNDPAALNQFIDTHLQDILGNTTINGNIEEWDVINEFTPIRDLEFALAGTPGYPTGREIYPEIFTKTAQLDPNTKLYINDYMTITSGGVNRADYDRYKSYVTELVNATHVDGIGFQAHISSFPVAPQTVYDILEDFHVTYGKEMKITEFDMIGVNPTINYEYMRDFLTITFSHPGVNGFLMWGYWDGLHWLDNAPMFDVNWNLKPGGQAFIDQVFNNWWSNETATTNAAGQTTIRAFKGKHLITVTHNGSTKTVPVVLGPDQTLQVVMDGLNGCLPAGTACNDGDLGTDNDLEDGNCNCIGTPIDVCNTLSNGDFRLGLANWNSNGDNLAVAVNQEAFVEVTVPGTNPWNTVLNQSDVSVELGTEYTLAYDARASLDRTINVKVGEAIAPYTGYYNGTDNLTTTMQSFTHTFTMSDPTDLSSLVEFHIGGFTGDVYIDNVRFAATSCVPPSFCNLVGPESFTTSTGEFDCLGCTASVDQGTAFVEIPAVTTNPWDVIFQAQGLNFEQGKRYEILFDARAEYGRIITLKTGSATIPYPQYTYSAFELGTAMKSYRTIITMLEPTDPSTNFEFFLGNSAANVYFDNIRVRDIGCGSTTQVSLTVLLEGCYDDVAGIHVAGLYDRSILPGQPNNNNPLGNSLPFAGPPWNYNGNEVEGFDSNIYINMAEDNGLNKAVDWVLVGFRTGADPLTTVGRKAGLLMRGGEIIFPQPIEFLENGGSYYVVVDHWSHTGVMTPSPVTVLDNTLTFDFSAQDSYRPGVGVGAKQVVPGTWVMYGGNCEQANESPGYDINGSDKQFWNTQNGLFDNYSPSDMNMDGDINAADRILWESNNGSFSELPR